MDAERNLGELVGLGFSRDVADAAISRKVPVTVMKALGTTRVVSIDDVIAVVSALAPSEPRVEDPAKLAGTFADIAWNTDYSLTNLVTLAREGRHNEEIWIYDEPAFRGRSITLADIVALAMVGVTSVPEIVALYRDGLTGKMLIGYSNGGVTNIRHIMALMHNRVSPEMVKLCREISVTDPERMIYLSNVVSYNTAKAYVEAGITGDRAMRALTLAKVEPENVLTYKTAGFGNPEDMLFLSGHNCTPEDATFFAGFGFAGNRDAMVRLKEAGLGNSTKPTGMYGVASEYHYKGRLERYVEAGFGGDVDAVIALHKAGVPGTFVRGFLELRFDGKPPTDKGELLSAVLGGYVMGSRPGAASAGESP